MPVTTEQILTSPRAFGLTTATPLQRALCRILDGEPLGELAHLPELVEAVGNVAALDGMGAPFEAHVLAAIRTAKSMIAAAKIVQLSQTVDLSPTSRGDIIRIPLAALKLEGTRPVMSHLVANMQSKPLLRPLLINEPTRDGVSLRHPSGRPIEVTPIPIDRAGGSAISVWNAGIVVDEEPRMLGEEDGVKNWDHLRQAVLGRILPGGQFIGIGSPWAPFGPIYDLFNASWGKPSADVVVFRARGPAMNPSWWTPARCDALQRRDPTAYRTDVLAEFADPESSLISSAEIERATRPEPLIVGRAAGHVYAAAMDPGTRGNAWTLAIGTRTVRPRDKRSITSIVFTKQWQGSKTDPLDPDKVLAEVAQILRGYGLSIVWTDQLAADFVVSIARRHGLAVQVEPITAPRKVEMFESLRMRLADDGLEIPNDPLVRADLLRIRKKTTLNGIAIDLPRTNDGRHCDHAPAIAMVAAHTYDQPAPRGPKPNTVEWWNMVDEAMKAPIRQPTAEQLEQSALSADEREARRKRTDAKSPWWRANPFAGAPRARGGIPKPQI